MNDTDTSDKAMFAESDQFEKNACFPSEAFQAGWRECRRRGEAQTEELRELIEVKDKALKLAHSLYQEEMESRKK